MNKVYLLLRNNKQSGPHSLGELIALAPKPFDLIWVEGRSIGWSYPTEIEGLKTYMADTNKAVQQTPSIAKTASYTSAENENSSKKISSGKIHVSLPRTETQPHKPVQDAEPAYSLEKKAEELRKKVQEYTAKSFSQENKFQTKYTRSMKAVEEDYTSGVYHQKIKKKNSFAKKPLFIVALLVGFITGSYFLTAPFFHVNPHRVEQVAIQPLSPQDTSKTISVEMVNLETEGLVSSEKPSQSLFKQNKSIAKIKEKSEPVSLAESHVNPSPSKEAINVKAESDPQNETTDNSSNSQEPIIQEPVVAAPKEKKKTLAEKIDGFFDKLGTKKQERPVSEDQSKTPTDGAERKSTRRNDETKTPVEVVDFASLIDITANNPDNWMMGVKGLKLTLRNRSNETIKTATVEVRYYNEQNSLLEKKLVYFNNVAPKKSLTVAAPDQRMADHADYRLLSVSNKEDSYAKQ
ncbi:MAG: FxLYD domain-containing protein [Bacteroidota bacterium]|nr:FxLYD domain-containing protein [Bacteroidota bacterium]